jgi:hypothetical protein
MLRLRRLSRNTLISFAGLLVGIVGLLIQWFADPAKFAEGAPFDVPFPPGIVFIVACGLLMLLTARWWWHAVFGVLIGFWIIVGGTLADKLIPNLTSDNLGTVAGNVIMTAGLVVAVVAGVFSMVTARRGRRTVRSKPDPALQR